MPIVKQFEFDHKVAVVFDDMVNRSVPFYSQVQELIISYISKNITKGDRVYDLGCSTASTLLALEQSTSLSLFLIGIDSSQAMLDQAKGKLLAYESKIELFQGDITTIHFLSSRYVIANYTLQFIRPVKRQALLKDVYNSLEEGGEFIISEKLICEDKTLNKDFIDIYYDYKKAQGYSHNEISQKREALENVLVPYTYEENVQMLKEAGFTTVEVLFRWVNFVTIIAKK